VVVGAVSRSLAGRHPAVDAVAQAHPDAFPHRLRVVLEVF
jgi:hypothetical protein